MAFRVRIVNVKPKSLAAYQQITALMDAPPILKPRRVKAQQWAKDRIS